MDKEFETATEAAAVIRKLENENDSIRSALNAQHKYINDEMEQGQ